MITSMYGLELAPPFFRIIPRRLLASPHRDGHEKEDGKAGPDAITMRKLAPTIHYEGALIAEMAGTVDAFRTVTADVLILGGSKGLPFLKPARDALARTLPHSRRVEFPRSRPRGLQRPLSTHQPRRQARDRRPGRPRGLFLLRHPNTPQETQ